MTSVAYKVATFLLLLSEVRSTSIQQRKTIYIDKENEAQVHSSWEKRPESPSVQVAPECTKEHNSTSQQEDKNASTADAHDNPSCPTWFFPESSLNNTCTCGNDIEGAVKCDNSTKEVSLLPCYCMTYAESTGPVVGTCFYNCVRRKQFDYTSILYHPVPSNVTKLDMCEYFNRAGQLCGKCKENYTIPIYSYDFNCVQCSASDFGWVKYILIAFLPLTVFFAFALSCRLRATSPKLSAFVSVSQTVSLNANVRALLGLAETYPTAQKLTRVILSLYGILNLDFFRTLIPHICVNVDTLEALALDYAIAFYPLILLVITYVFIEVHTCNFKALRFVSKPFHWCAKHFQIQWDVRASIVEAFATFLLLSYIKLRSVSFDLLAPTRVYHVNGSLVGMYLYYDATVEYFGDKHLPYAVLALFVMLVFIFFPLLLLLLYPMRFIQRCLGCCGVRWHALHIFIDAFQGYYKDGTNGTRDCRYFATALIICRIVLFLIYAFTLTTMIYGVAALVFMGLAMAIVIMQPYKDQFSRYNTVDSVLILVLALGCATVVFSDLASLKAQKWITFTLILGIAEGIVPLFYITFVTLHWVCTRKELGQRVNIKIHCWIRKNPRQLVPADLEESLLDRLINPAEYDEDMTNPVASLAENSTDQSSGHPSTATNKK